MRKWVCAFLLLVVVGGTAALTFPWMATAQAPTIVSGLSTTSARAYEVTTVALERTIYTDDARTITSLPAYIDGDMIRTASRDMYDSSPELLSFNVDRQVMVYIMFDSRAVWLPSWLSANWQDTGDQVEVSGGVFYTVYERVEQTGDVRLAGNAYPPQWGADMYWVVVQEIVQPTPTPLPPTPTPTNTPMPPTPTAIPPTATPIPPTPTPTSVPPSGVPRVVSFAEDGQIIALNEEATISIVLEDLDGIEDITKVIVWVDDDLSMGLWQPSTCITEDCRMDQCPVMANWWVTELTTFIPSDISTEMTVVFHVRPMDCPMAGCDVDLDVAVVVADSLHDGVYAKVGTIRVAL